MDIMTFSLEKEMLERRYNKRDAFVLMGCDLPEYAQNPRIITEQENTQGLPNYADFIVHRHDQDIWSLMVKKYHLKKFRAPSRFVKYGDITK